MIDPKLKVAVDYGKCHPERCNKGVCAAVLECPTKLWKQEDPYDLPYPVPGFCQDCAKCVEACPLKARQLLQIPDEEWLLSVVAIGHPAETPEKGRKELDEITFTDKYGLC